jgi:hypothetical protein
MKLELSRQILEKSSDITFHENPSSESRVVPFGRTDGRDEANCHFAVLRTRLRNQSVNAVE